ncbi:MAG: TonB-dependent receptor [Moraxella sp.]|nr:TonB-dependent receptor [Moraxella sp.]
MSKMTLKASIALLLSPTAVMANTPHVELDPINITVSRSPQTSSQTPARVAVIGETDIQKNPIANLNDILKQDASVNMVQSGGMGQTSSVFLRGTNSSHTLVLRDGVRLNGASTGSASLSFLDLTDIERIEIQKGASSVLYGSDAIGGVVQMVSKTPVKTGGFITGIYGENNTYKAIVGGDFVADNGLYAQLRGQRLESDGTPVVGEIAFDKNASYDQKGGSAKIGYKNDKVHLSADLSHNQGTNEYVGYAWGVGYDELSHDFKNQSINLKGQLDLNEQFSLNTRLSQFKDELNQNNPNAQNQYDFVHNTTQEAEIYGTYRFSPQQNILLGITHQKLQGDVYSASAWSDVRYDETVKSTGYFAQHQYHSDKINTQVGIRLEDNDKYGTQTVGQGAVRYHFTPNTSVYTNIGSAFNAPTTNQLYATAWGANPDLKPEESLSYEIGLDQKLGKNTTLGISAYHTKVDNLIAWSGSKNINIDKAKLTGGELSATWRQDDYFVKAGYHYVQPKNDTTKQDLSRRSRHHGVLTLGLDNGQYGLSTTIHAKSKSKDWSADYHNAGHATLDVNAHWHINNQVKLFTSIENAGNVRYTTAYEGSVDGVYYRHGGRQANIGITFGY